MVDRVVEEIEAAFDPTTYRAVVMMGGFGRGEGGVIAVDGQEEPHNNLDFLMVARSGGREHLADLRDRMCVVFEKLVEEFGIGIDHGVVSELKLRNSPCLIMWYDMRYGHKHLLGDADFLPSLSRFEADRIDPWDMLRLLVNRGSLLVINDLVLEKDALSTVERKLVVKHVMKALIGYGDALLFFHGQYHWSYAERQQRMADDSAVPMIDSEMRALYDEAADFRFRPDYDAYLARDLKVWMAELRVTLGRVHLDIESMRLGREVTWETYAQTSLAHRLTDQVGSPRAWAIKALGFAKGSSSPEKLPFLAKLGHRASREKELFALSFPTVGYHLDAEPLGALTRNYLGVAKNCSDLSVLRRAYLRKYAVIGDANFMATVKKYNLSIEA